jgi:hypothetical protein
MMQHYVITQTSNWQVCSVPCGWMRGIPVFGLFPHARRTMHPQMVREHTGLVYPGPNTFNLRLHGCSLSLWADRDRRY